MLESRPQLRPRGYPSGMEELNLKVDFRSRFRYPTLELAHTQVPSWKPTPNQTEKYLAFLYGIYFYDHVCGGQVLSGYTSCNEVANDYRQENMHQAPLSEDDLPLSADDLSTWPLHLSLERNSPCEHPGGIIELPVNRITDTDPFGTETYYGEPSIIDSLRRLTKHKLTRVPQRSPFRFSCNPRDYNILTGIEEAHHSHFDSLERDHYGATFPQYGPIGPLRSLKSRLRIDLNKHFSYAHHVEYDSLLGHEFAAHIVQAEYVRRYLPYVWENGFREFDQAVRDCRRQKLDSRNKSR